MAGLSGGVFATTEARRDRRASRLLLKRISALVGGLPASAEAAGPGEAGPAAWPHAPWSPRRHTAAAAGGGRLGAAAVAATGVTVTAAAADLELVELPHPGLLRAIHEDTAATRPHSGRALSCRANSEPGEGDGLWAGHVAIAFGGGDALIEKALHLSAGWDSADSDGRGPPARPGAQQAKGSTGPADRHASPEGDGCANADVYGSRWSGGAAPSSGGWPSVSGRGSDSESPARAAAAASLSGSLRSRGGALAGCRGPFVRCAGPGLPGFRRTIWLLLESPFSSGLATTVTAVLALAVIGSVAGFVASTVPDLRADPAALAALDALESACVAIFVGELLLRLLACPDLRAYLSSAPNALMLLIDVVIIVPFFVRLGMGDISARGSGSGSGSGADAGSGPGSSSGSNGGSGTGALQALAVLRVARLLKFIRYVESLQVFVIAMLRAGHAIGMLLFFISLGLVVFSSCIYYAERDLNTKGFGSIPEAFWWCITTLTTVGYGDVTPVSPSGRLIASLTMISGLFLLSLPMTVIGSTFAEVLQERQEAADAAEAEGQAEGLLRLEGTLAAAATAAAAARDHHRAAGGRGGAGAAASPWPAGFTPGGPAAAARAALAIEPPRPAASDADEAEGNAIDGGWAAPASLVRLGPSGLSSAAAAAVAEVDEDMAVDFWAMRAMRGVMEAAALAKGAPCGCGSGSGIDKGGVSSGGCGPGGGGGAWQMRELALAVADACDRLRRGGDSEGSPRGPAVCAAAGPGRPCG